MGIFRIQISFLITDRLIHINIKDMIIICQRGNGMISSCYIAVIEDFILCILLFTHLHNALNDDPGIRIPLMQRVHDLRILCHEILCGSSSKLIDTDHDIDLSILLFLKNLFYGTHSLKIFFQYLIDGQ